MIIRTLFAASLTLAMLPATSIAGDWQVDAAASNLRFSGAAQGESFTGEFQRFTADIRFDPSDLASARFDVRIPLDSLDSRNAERDDALRSEDFFDIAQHGEARFVADTFTATEAGKFVASGQLTLRGVTSEVALEFSWKENDGLAELDGKANLRRLAFGVGGGDWADTDLIDDAVRVTTHLQLSKLPATQ